ncbi:MAG: DNA-processing protein DprA [Candidatus Woykebacteria bacterium]
MGFILSFIFTIVEGLAIISSMVKDSPYYIALAAAPGIGPVRFQVLLKHFKSAETIWKADEKTLKEILTPKLFEQFTEFRKSFDIQRYLDKISKLNIIVITLNDKNYPKLLKEISDAPPVLYIRGQLPDEKRVIAVVGTRKITNYGREVTEILVRDLVNIGFTIVSGLARGVDSHSHRVTIGNSGKTIAVLGGGLDRVYPAENRALADEIAKGNGAVISEFPVGMDSVPGNFPARNRIISGLSLGVLVTEAGEDSGSLITAGLAGEQGREVFAVAGPMYSKLAKGPAALIKQGAKLVMNIEDILEELQISGQEPETRDQEGIKGDSEDEQKILYLMGDEPAHIDQIARHTKLSASKAGSILSLMEIKGKIRSLGGGNYSLNR